MHQVFQISDLPALQEWPKPPRLAVIGQPISHSASPRMHQPALDAAGIAASYIRLEVAPGEVGEAFTQMRELGFIGCNVTVPHKLEAMEHCEVHPDAAALGAVNTIRFDSDVTRGFNTDGPGFARAIEEIFGVDLSSLRVVIAGAGGGAGQALATQCALVGVREVVLVNRTIAKLVPLTARLLRIQPQMKVTAISFDDAALPELCRAADLLVNATSLGLKPGDSPVLPATCLRAGQLVFDTIYQPPVTPLLALAETAGCRTGNGFSMLLHQGALAFQLWFPGTEPLAVMRKALASND